MACLAAEAGRESKVNFAAAHAETRGGAQRVLGADRGGGHATLDPLGAWGRHIRAQKDDRRSFRFS
jgi:hypothetical protein